MNEYFYEILIEPILYKKPILDKKRIRFSEKKKKINLHILLHMGTPCDKRYCICKYINFKDIELALT